MVARPEIDWLARIEGQRRQVPGGTVGTWEEMWESEPDPEQRGGPPIGIMAVEPSQAAPNPIEVEKGIEPEVEYPTREVATLAWDQHGEELAHSENLISYLCDLHNRFPFLASELRWLRAMNRQAEALLTQAAEALAASYDVSDYPADGGTSQDAALAAIRAYQQKGAQPC